MKTLIVALSTFSTLFVAAAWAGTYNFYFNETEQKNSPATAPTPAVVAPASVPVSVTMPAPAPSPALPAPAPVATATPEVPPAVTPAVSAVSAPNQSSITIEKPFERWPREFRRVRFTFSPSIVWRRENYVGSSWDPTFERYTPSTWEHVAARAAGGLNLGVYLSKGVALNFFGGAYSYSDTRLKPFLGGELELIPLRLSIWKFTDLIEWGFMAGASSLMRAPGNYATMHVGSRLTFNFIDDLSLTAAARANLGYIQGEAGLVLRL